MKQDKLLDVLDDGGKSRQKEEELSKYNSSAYFP
jgi:hypothetical protein